MSPENPERLWAHASQLPGDSTAKIFAVATRPRSDLGEGAFCAATAEYIRADIAAAKEEGIVRALSAVQDEREALRARYHSADEGRCSIAKEASSLAPRLAEVTAERDAAVALQATTEKMWRAASDSAEEWRNRCESSSKRGRDMVAALDRAEKAEAERDRLRKLFDDAGQGEHNVLALVDHYQAGLFAEERRVAALREALRVIVMRSLASVDDPTVEVMAYEIADAALTLDSEMTTDVVVMAADDAAGGGR